MELLQVRQSAYKSLTVREKRRERILLALVFFFFLLTVIAVVYSLSLQMKIENPTVYRSNEEMVNGGKRFIDGFYSLNSGTIDRDQYRAIQMIMDADKRDIQMQKLTRQDLIRKVRSSGMQSRIEWTNSEIDILEEGGGFLRVRYKTYLIRNERSASPIDVVLVLVPVEKTDINTDGVGVFDWVDIAENPFEVSDEE